MCLVVSPWDRVGWSALTASRFDVMKRKYELSGRFGAFGSFFFFCFLGFESPAVNIISLFNCLLNPINRLPNFSSNCLTESFVNSIEMLFLYSGYFFLDGRTLKNMDLIFSG